MFDSSSVPVVIMPYLRYVCLFPYNGVQHILRCSFCLYVFVLWLLCPMLPVPLDCSFLLPLRCSLTCIYFYIPLHAIPVYVELFVFIVTFSICQLCHEYQMHRYSELTGEKPALEQTSENVNI